MPREILVSVLVPFLNEERYLEACVLAMLRQDLEGEAEFLFVDGRSEDRSREILQRFASEDSRVKILENPARRTAAGLNVGLRAARGEFIARMDAHTVYPTHYLQRGVDRLRRGDVAWVTGPQIPAGRGPWSRAVGLALGGWLGRGSSEKWPGAIDAATADAEEFELRTSVFTGVWRRATLDELGGWDEGWPVNQDSEMAARLLERGGRIVCRPDMGAEYVPRDTLTGLARQYARYGFYRSKTFVRHPASLPRSRWFPVAVLASGIATVLPIRRLRRLGGLGFAAYLVAVGVISVRAAERPADTSRLVPVFLSMHLAWAVGFVTGLARHLPRRAELRERPAPIERGGG